MLRLLIAVLLVLGLSFAPPVHAGEHAADGNSEITQELLAAAEAGDADAQFQLGQAYAKTVKATHAERLRWYRLAAEQGHVEAQIALGISYNSGKGVVQDYDEAVRWYRKAAEQGDAAAQFLLALMYQQGKDVEKDDETAARWSRSLSAWVAFTVLPQPS